jgi:hypothetical protein
MSLLKKKIAWAWRKWLPIAHVIGNFQAQVILSAFYFLMFLPLGVIMRLLDPLKTRLYKSKARSSFEKWTFPRETIKSSRKPF